MVCELDEQQTKQIQKNFITYCESVLNAKTPILIATTSDLENKLHGQIFTDALVDAALSSCLYLNKKIKIDEEFGAKVYGYDNQTIAILYEISEDRPLQQNAKAISDIEKLIKKYEVDGVVASLSVVPGEIPFRVKWADKIKDLGCNYGHGPGLTNEILIGGFSKIDFIDLFDKSETILNLVSNRDVVAYHLVSENGTNFVMYREPQSFWESDSRLIKKQEGGKIFGEMGNLPPGEVYLEWEHLIFLEDMEEPMHINFPIKSYGTWVCDVSVGGIIRDLRKTNTKIQINVGLVNNLPDYTLLGKCTGLKSEDKSLEAEVMAQLEECPPKHKDVNQTVIIYSQELGIGLLDLDEITGNLLLDEKHLGAHLALGKYFSHVDFLQKPDGLKLHVIKKTKLGAELNKEQLDKELMNIPAAISKDYLVSELIMENGELVI